MVNTKDIDDIAKVYYSKEMVDRLRYNGFWGVSLEQHMRNRNKAVYEGKGFPAGCGCQAGPGDSIWWVYETPEKYIVPTSSNKLIIVCGGGFLCESCGQAAGLEW